MSNLRILEFEPQGGRKTKSPAWARTVLVSPDGSILLPAALFGSETQVILCAMIDGVPVTTYKKHGYVPLDWALRDLTVRKEIVDQAENIRQNVKRALDNLKEV